MKAKRIYIGSALVALVLCAAMLCSAILPVAGEETLPSLEYHNPTMENNVTLSAADLYELLLEKTPTEGEALYWAESDLTMTYTPFVPTSRISTEYDGANGILQVFVRPYTYLAANGAEVTWNPTNLLLDGESHDLQLRDDVYVAVIENCFYSNDFSMKVDYEWQVEISKDVIAALRNDAYEKGNAAHEEMETYRNELMVYNNLVEMHRKWDEYEKWEREYADYLAELAVYNALKATYDAYLAEHAEYERLLDAYNQWQNYFAQQKAYADNEKPYAEYMEFYRVYQAAVGKMAMFESIFQKDSRGWSMYADITGQTVSQVLDNQLLLMVPTVDANDIRAAGAATQDLRVLLQGYAELRNANGKSEYAKNKALYEYYSANYDALKTNFSTLYHALKDLYDESQIVRKQINSRGKTEHYLQMVGHLYVITYSLESNTPRDDRWRMSNKKLTEVIEPVHYFEDGDWDPRNTVFPATEVPRVDRIEKPVPPTVTQPTVKPEAPTPVPNPGKAPTPVDDPSKTPKPEQPKPLGPAPQPPVLDAIEQKLCQEVENGTLKYYDSVIRAKQLTMTATVEREISIQNLKTVTLYYADGNVYQSISVNYGESLYCPPLARENTAEYTYTWLGWTTLDGSDPNTDFITEDMALYPLYRSVKKTYTITWVVDGVSYPTTLYYGAMPVPETVVNITPHEGQYYRYEFSGWDREIQPVTGDATYIGSMVQIPKKFKVTWVIKNGAEKVEQLLEYGTMPVFEGDLSVQSPQFIYEFTGWDKNITVVSGDVTYTACYSATPLAVGSMNTPLEVLHSADAITVIATASSVQVEQAARLAASSQKLLRVMWEDQLCITMNAEQLTEYLALEAPRLILQAEQAGEATIYRFRYYFASGATDTPNATVELSYRKADGKETLFELQTDDGWQRLQEPTFAAEGAFSVRCIYSYSIVPVANEFCNVTQMQQSAIAGDIVSLKLDCVYGYEVVGATLTFADGRETVVEGLSFQMPGEPITVTLHTAKIIYTVIFTVDGAVWSSEEYELGEAILLPASPQKDADENYAYAFMGWGDVPTLATGENKTLTFEAQFSKVEIPKEEPTKEKGIFLSLILPILICVVATGAIVVVIILIVRRKKSNGATKVRMGKHIASIFKKK